MGTVENSVEKNVGKMEAQLREWGAKIDELATKAEKAGAEVKADYRQRLEELKVKRATAQARLDELKGAGNQKWLTLKSGLEAAWKDLEIAFKDATR